MTSARPARCRSAPRARCGPAFRSCSTASPRLRSAVPSAGGTREQAPGVLEHLEGADSVPRASTVASDTPSGTWCASSGPWPSSCRSSVMHPVYRCGCSGASVRVTSWRSGWCVVTSRLHAAESTPAPAPAPAPRPHAAPSTATTPRATATASPPCRPPPRHRTSPSRRCRPQRSRREPPRGMPAHDPADSTRTPGPASAGIRSSFDRAQDGVERPGARPDTRTRRAATAARARVPAPRATDHRRARSRPRT